MLSKDLVEVITRADASFDQIGSELGDIIKRCGSVVEAPSIRPDDSRFHATNELKAACQGLLGMLQNIRHVAENVKTYSIGTESL
jgi:hypothetical protein